LPHITTKVKDGQLEISSDQSIRNMKILTIKAQTAQLDALLVNGAANILINGLIGDVLQSIQTVRLQSRSMDALAHSQPPSMVPVICRRPN